MRAAVYLFDAAAMVQAPECSRMLTFMLAGVPLIITAIIVFIYYKMDVENVRKMIGEDNIGYFRKDIALTKVMDLIYNNAKINLISEEEAAARMAEEVKKQAEAGEEQAEEGEDK